VPGANGRATLQCRLVPAYPSIALKKLHTLTAVIGIVLAGGLAWWWQNKPTAAATAASPGAAAPRGGGPPGAGGPVTVEVGKVERLTLTDDVLAVGSLRSRQGVMLRPEVSGRIARLGFGDGQRVRRGQLLVQLDDTLQQAQLKQAEAQAGIARTNLQRSRELLAQNFVSQSSVDQNAAALTVSEAQVALAQAQASRMRVLAPFDGLAGIRKVELGDYVKDGADLVNIEDISAMAVDFSLPERYLARVRAGQPVEVLLDALPGKRFNGRIEALDSSVDANGRALLVRAMVENPGALLKAGMFARPRVVFEVRENALVVPEEALVPLGARQVLFTVVDGPGGQKVSRRIDAQVGMRLPGKVELLGGVAAGDVVVTAGQSRLLRGDALPVRVVDLANPAASGSGRPTPAAGSAPASAADKPARPSTLP
jgi:membrane fusion protein, multidrug efflux system